METNVKYMAVTSSTLRQLKSRKMTCYGCIYYTRQERCNWFYHNGKGHSKPVPDSVKIKGCKQRVGIKAKGNEALQMLIDKFEGEII